MNVVFVEDPELAGDPAFGPSGAKGIGEPPTIAPAPAIINAINDALARLGIETTRLPATRENIMKVPGGSQTRRSAEAI
jgi:CO/xanthine dehydrogenase Mo-binding subunit